MGDFHLSPFQSTCIGYAVKVVKTYIPNSRYVTQSQRLAGLKKTSFHICSLSAQCTLHLHIVQYNHWKFRWICEQVWCMVNNAFSLWSRFPWNYAFCVTNILYFMYSTLLANGLMVNKGFVNRGMMENNICLIYSYTYRSRRVSCRLPTFLLKWSLFKTFSVLMIRVHSIYSSCAESFDHLTFIFLKKEEKEKKRNWWYRYLFWHAINPLSGSVNYRIYWVSPYWHWSNL